MNMLQRAGRALAQVLVFSAAAVSALPAAAQSPEYQRAYRDGFDQGFKEGYDRAMREGRGGPGNPPPGAAVVPMPPPPKRGVIVMRAWYGDGERRACELTGWAARRFNGRTSVSVEVTNAICGDPAPGQRKELVVEYMCGGESKRASAYEHRSLSLSCY